MTMTPRTSPPRSQPNGVEHINIRIIPGRCYYEKRVGLRWEIWFCHSDSSADPASGATEWKAVSTRFWRWRTAARITNEIWCAFNDGVWIANCRHADADNAAAADPVLATDRGGK